MSRCVSRKSSGVRERADPLAREGSTADITVHGRRHSTSGRRLSADKGINGTKIPCCDLPRGGMEQ